MSDPLNVVVAVLLIGVAISVAVYWVSYYRGGDVRVTDADWYRRFQDAFVAADAWLVVTAVIGAVGLLAGQRFGLVFALLAATPAPIAAARPPATRGIPPAPP